VLRLRATGEAETIEKICVFDPERQSQIDIYLFDQLPMIASGRHVCADAACGGGCNPSTAQAAMTGGPMLTLSHRIR
jgi:hypothetical protein